MSERTKVIDAHHHFWNPASREYPWMAGTEMEPIRRPFQPADLEPLLAAAGVDATVLVQTVSDLAETREFLAIADATPFLAGVVGWVDLTDPGLNGVLEELQAGPHGKWLVGIRHQVHDEADPAWLLWPDVQRGLETVSERGLAYDFLIRPREIPAALETARRLSGGRFVVDHIAKPEIARGKFDKWSVAMAPFAELEHVFCKLSGMVTEADWNTWTPADLRPYVQRTVEIFGPERVMFGSDWPVSLLAAPYTVVKSALETALGPLSDETHAAIFGGNAARFYRLP